MITIVRMGSTTTRPNNTDSATNSSASFMSYSWESEVHRANIDIGRQIVQLLDVMVRHDPGRDGPTRPLTSWSDTTLDVIVRQAGGRHYPTRLDIMVRHDPGRSGSTPPGNLDAIWLHNSFTWRNYSAVGRYAI